MDHREKILQIVNENGPLLPGQINKQLRTNVLFASAMLSEMVDNKKVRLTAMKVGGSPLYYIEGQESKLEPFADRLDPKEFKAFQLLKKSKILRDRDHEPEMRVALREIKDFAVPLEVTANGAKDLFWKYFLVEDADAENMIKDYLNKMAAPEKPQDPTQDTPAKEDEQKEVQASLIEEEKPVKEESQEEEPPKEDPAPEPEEPAATAEVKAQTAPETAKVPKPITSLKMTPLDEDELAYHYEPSFSFSTEIDTDEKVSIEKQKVEVIPEVPEFPDDEEFFDSVNAYFKERDIEIMEFNPVRKNSEYEFMISLPTNIGPVDYYCRAKHKSKVTEMDLSPAFVQGQIRKVPVLFLTNGDPTGKTDEMLKKDFKSIVYRKLE